MIIIAGIGTEVGKTTFSMQLAKKIHAHYWKPVECGEEKDSETAVKFLGKERVLPPLYSFDAPLSPHAASELAKVPINLEKILPPCISSPLIIEMAGGVLTPLTYSKTNLDLFTPFEANWILVSRHYVGSINHTLLTISLLKDRNVSLTGIVFSGKENPASEKAILSHFPLPLIGRIYHDDLAPIH